MKAASDNASTNAVDAEERLRAEFYDFLALILSRPPTPETLARLTALEPGGGALGDAIAALAALAAKTTAAKASEEYHALFIGLGRGELVPYASYYMTGFLHEKPLAALRRDMDRLMIERAPDVFEPEDNAASLCEMMAGLICGRFGRPASISAQRDFFNAHLNPWAAHFFADLAAAKNAVLYAPVGAMGQAFMAIERDAFRLAPSA